jgi:hypothetical protein
LRITMPYYRGKRYGPDASVLLVGAAVAAVYLAHSLLRHAGILA